VRLTAAPSSLADLVLEAVEHAADAGVEFVNRLWTEATRAHADIRPEEVAHFTRELWQTVMRKRNVLNPTGMVINSIGGIVRLQLGAYRQAVEQQKQQLAEQRKETAKFWREILADPEERELHEQARQMLHELQQGA
jgi:hypothetical protein